jgi:hypothetical protein
MSEERELLRKALDYVDLEAETESLNVASLNKATKLATNIRALLAREPRQEAVAWCVRYEDPSMGSIHSNPTMYEPEAHAIANRAVRPVAVVPLYASPPDHIAAVEALGYVVCEGRPAAYYNGYRFVLPGDSTTHSYELPWHPLYHKVSR